MLIRLWWSRRDRAWRFARAARMTKADLAREIDKNPASIRRLLTLEGANPELRTVVAMANALDADIRLVPRAQSARRGRRLAGAT